MSGWEIVAVVALVYSIPSLVNKSRDLSTQIPFGPFIIVGCLIYVLFANQIKNLLDYCKRCSHKKSVHSHQIRFTDHISRVGNF